MAYLTGYSPCALFGYLDNIAGPTLLVLAAVAVFALSAQAASKAVLGMFGAYAAPAFGLGQPGPLVLLRWAGLAAPPLLRLSRRSLVGK